MAQTSPREMLGAERIICPFQPAAQASRWGTRCAEQLLSSGLAPLFRSCISRQSGNAVPIDARNSSCDPASASTTSKPFLRTVSDDGTAPPPSGGFGAGSAQDAKEPELARFRIVNMDYRHPGDIPEIPETHGFTPAPGMREKSAEPFRLSSGSRRSGTRSNPRARPWRRTPTVSRTRFLQEISLGAVAEQLRFTEISVTAHVASELSYRQVGTALAPISAR